MRLRRSDVYFVIDDSGVARKVASPESLEPLREGFKQYARVIAGEDESVSIETFRADGLVEASKVHGTLGVPVGRSKKGVVFRVVEIE